MGENATTAGLLSIGWRDATLRCAQCGVQSTVGDVRRWVGAPV
jgi:hypothetical protein